MDEKIIKKMIKTLNSLQACARRHNYNLVNRRTGEIHGDIQKIMDRYNDLRDDYPVEWRAFCDSVNAVYDHEAFDCLA